MDVVVGLCKFRGKRIFEEPNATSVFHCLLFKLIQFVWRSLYLPLIWPVIHWIWKVEVSERLFASHFQVLGLLAVLNWLLWLEGQRRNLLQPKSSSAAWEPTWCTAVRLELDRYQPHSDIFAFEVALLHRPKSVGVVLFQAAKICNNMLLAIGMIGTSETMNLGIRYEWASKRESLLQPRRVLATLQCSSLAGSALIPNCWRRSWTWAQVGAGPVTPIIPYLGSWKGSHPGITTRAASALSSWLRSAPRPRLLISCLFQMQMLNLRQIVPPSLLSLDRHFCQKFESTFASNKNLIDDTRNQLISVAGL